MCPDQAWARFGPLRIAWRPCLASAVGACGCCRCIRPSRQQTSGRCLAVQTMHVEDHSQLHAVLLPRWTEDVMVCYPKRLSCCCPREVMHSWQGARIACGQYLSCWPTRLQHRLTVFCTVCQHGRINPEHVRFTLRTTLHGRLLLCPRRVCARWCWPPTSRRPA